MLILGGNAVGLELTQLFARLGVNVTVVEILDRLAPYEEPEISHAIEGIFADEGIAVATSTTVTNVHHDDHTYTVTVETDGEPVKISTEQLLVATGRRPATAGLGLDAVGAKVGDRDQLIVDDHLRTTNRRIWAAGDITGHTQFVYVAAARGGLVVDNAFGQNPRALDYAISRGSPSPRPRSPQSASPTPSSPTKMWPVSAGYCPLNTYREPSWTATPAASSNSSPNARSCHHPAYSRLPKTGRKALNNGPYSTLKRPLLQG